MSLRQYEMTCLTKKAGSIWLCRRLPPAFLCVFCNCVCLPSPWSIYADSPTEIFPRGCYIGIFYIRLSAFHLPTQFLLLLLFDCDIFKLPVIFNLKTGDIFIRKSKRGKDRLRYAIPSFAKNHISQALSGWSMWLFVGLFCNTPVFLPIF